MSTMRRVGSMGPGGGEPPVGAAGQLPTPLMDRPMMGPAHQGQIRQVGGATIQPMDQVVALAPGKRPGAVGDHTAAVAHGQGHALGGADDAGGAAQVHRVAGGAAQDRGQPGQGGLESVRQAALATAVAGLGAVVAAGMRMAAGLLGSWMLVTDLAADQDPGHRAIAGQPATGLGGQRSDPAVELTPHRAGVAQQAVQVHRHHQLGRRPPVWGS
jgi:hypothetical protein